MCGPPDFAALNTCIAHLVELSAAGIATYSVCKAASHVRKRRPGRTRPAANALRAAPATLLVEGSNEHQDS